MPRLKRPLAERLWSFVSRRNADECWEWRGHRNDRGYGFIQIDGKPTRAHRVAYAVSIGPVPDDLVVMHVCDNPPCCNPAHLRLGTIAENNADRHAKGRSVIPVNPLRPECQRGHAFDDVNTAIEPVTGQRRCRTCRTARQRERRAARGSYA